MIQAAPIKSLLKAIILIIMLSLALGLNAQIGIKTNTPKNTVDIEAVNAANPSNTDGLLIPRLDAFPDSDPGAEQDGMLIFLNNDIGNFKKGLHFWDNDSGFWKTFGHEWKDGYNSNGDNLIYAKQAKENGVDITFFNDGRGGFGTDDPQENLEIKFDGDNDIQISSSTNPNAPNLIYYTRNGTFSSGDFLNTDDVIGEIAGKVWDGSGPSDVVVSITSKAYDDHGSGHLPSKFDFSVTAVGDTSAAASGIEMTIDENGVGLGQVSPSAGMHIKGGTAAANSAPLKFTAGPNMTTAETGAFEYDGSHLYFTPNTTRHLVLKGLTNSSTIDFPNIPIDSSAEQTATVSGATLGSSCSCAPSGTIETGLKWSCYVSAANTVTIRLSNISGSSINPANKSWKVTVIE